MDENVEDKNIDSLAGEISQLERYVQSLQEQIRLSQLELETLTMTIGVLKDINNAGKSSLFSVGSGVYVKAKVTDTKKVLLDLNGGIVAEKPVSEVEKIIEERLEQRTVLLKKMSDDFLTTMNKIQTLTAKVNEILDQARKRE